MDRDDWKMLISFVLLVVVLVTGCFGTLYVWEGITCKQTANAMQVDYTYDFWKGCMINYHGQWVPLDSFKVVDVK